MHFNPHKKVKMEWYIHGILYKEGKDGFAGSVVD